MFRWYVINTYSGHENKVKANLEHRIVSMNQAPRFRGSRRPVWVEAGCIPGRTGACARGRWAATGFAAPELFRWSRRCRRVSRATSGSPGAACAARTSGSTS